MLFELHAIMAEGLSDAIYEIDWCLQQPEASQLDGKLRTRILRVRDAMEALRAELETATVETGHTSEG